MEIESGEAFREMVIARLVGDLALSGADRLAIEEPLEIRLIHNLDGTRRENVLSVTMRTPGSDIELAIGFLFTEGIIRDSLAIANTRLCSSGNTVRIELKPGISVDLKRLERHFYTSSSCGVCGKTSLDSVRTLVTRGLSNGPIIDPSVIQSLPARLRAAQPVFEQTGGLHASAIFEPSGKLVVLREDVGRHNALDKVIGTFVLSRSVPIESAILLVSGRASFELVQKAVMAGIPILAAVGAPSSLAVELARDHGLTLIGFVRDDRFNIYSSAERIRSGSVDTIPSTPREIRMPLAIIEPPVPTNDVIG